MMWICEGVFNYFAINDKIEIAGLILQAWWTTVELSNGDWMIVGPTLRLFIK